MRLILVRHAIALDREDWNYKGKPDHDRPLSERGVERFRLAATGLANLISSPEIVISSPLTRARQTAELLAEAYTDLEIVESDSLSPGGSEDKLLKIINGYSIESSIYLTGHEPDMGYLLGSFLNGASDINLHFKKGAAASIVFLNKASFGAGVLEWFIPPRVLRGYA